MADVDLSERVTDIKLQDTMTPPILGGGREVIRTPTCTVTPKLDPSRTMRSIEWHGKRSMKTCMRPVPAITDQVGATGSAQAGGQGHALLSHHATPCTCTALRICADTEMKTACALDAGAHGIHSWSATP